MGTFHALLVFHLAQWQTYGYVSRPVSLTVSPSRRQVFEYETLSLGCDPANGSEDSPGESGSGWRVWRVPLPDAPNLVSPSACGEGWGTHQLPCTINFAKKFDTATYWCQSATGQKSNMVNITVHDGPVILESPILPVVEGLDVTLMCTMQSPSSGVPVDFYKDGLLTRTVPTAQMTIHNVSKSDEGLYKCSLPGLEHSPESWLAVRAPLRVSLSEPEEEVEMTAPLARSLMWRAVCFPLVIPLYCICTILLMSMCCSTAAKSHGTKPRGEAC